MSGTTSSPTGWCVARLEELFETITDGDHQAPPQVAEGVPFLVIGNVRTSRLDFTDVRFVSEAYYQSLAEHRKPARGDLLYTVTGSLGIPALVDTDRPFCVQRHIAMLKPARETNVRYLFHALASAATFQQATKAATGTAQKTLGLASLRTITVHVAPADEQARVVDAIDSLLSRLDAAVATLEAAQTKLKAYRASVLKAAVDGRLVPTEAALARAENRDFEPADVLLKRILCERRRRWEEDELAKVKAAGKSPKDDKWKAKYEDAPPPDTKGLPELPEGWCWASPAQVFSWASGDFLPKKNQATGTVPVYGGNGVNGYHDVALVQQPTLVVGRVGAQCGNLHITDGPSWITDNAIYAVEPVPMANLAYWKMAMVRQNLNANAGGTGQPYVNQRHLNDLRVPLPPASEQHAIVEMADVLLSGADAVEAQVTVDRRRCARLRQAVLKWAFEGKLVDQEPTDEPAEKLLERIRTERADTETPKKIRRARNAK